MQVDHKTRWWRQLRVHSVNPGGDEVHVFLLGKRFSRADQQSSVGAQKSGKEKGGEDAKMAGWERRWKAKMSVPKPSNVRLGNLIDAWYFGTLGSKLRVKEFRMIHAAFKEGTFGKYLELGVGVTLRGPERVAALIRASSQFWALCTYSNVKSALPELATDLRVQMKAYELAHHDALCKLGPDGRVHGHYDGGQAHCVIHWRVGDFVALVRSPFYSA